MSFKDRTLENRKTPECKTQLLAPCLASLWIPLKCTGVTSGPALLACLLGEVSLCSISWRWFSLQSFILSFLLRQSPKRKRFSCTYILFLVLITLYHPLHPACLWSSFLSLLSGPYPILTGPRGWHLPYCSSMHSGCILMEPQDCTQKVGWLTLLTDWCSLRASTTPVMPSLG